MSDTCPCIIAFGTPEFCEGHTPAVRTLARQIAEVYQPAPITDEKVGWFMEDSATVVAELGDGPFGVVEAAEGIKPEGYLNYGFEGIVLIVDDVWFAILSGKEGSSLVRLSEAEHLHLWRYSVGEACPEDCVFCKEGR